MGYTQGGVEKPSYGQVCSGTTGHTEGLQLSFDPAVVSYEALCDKLLAVVRRASARTTGRGAGAEPSAGRGPQCPPSPATPAPR